MMKPSFLLKKGDGWNEVGSVLDIKIQPGKFELDNGQEIGGDLLAIIMRFESHDAGQVALRKLREMEPRIIDVRVVGQERQMDMSIILCGDETDDVDSSRYAILARVLGIRPDGASPEIVGAGGNIVGDVDLFDD